MNIGDRVVNSSHALYYMLFIIHIDIKVNKRDPLLLRGAWSNDATNIQFQLTLSLIKKAF